jgi:IS5 family transposase
MSFAEVKRMAGLDGVGRYGLKCQECDGGLNMSPGRSWTRVNTCAHFAERLASVESMPGVRIHKGTGCYANSEVYAVITYLIPKTIAEVAR